MDCSELLTVMKALNLCEEQVQAFSQHSITFVTEKFSKLITKQAMFANSYPNKQNKFTFSSTYSSPNI